MNGLIAALTQNGLVDGNFIILDRASDGSVVQVVEISDFETMFGSTDGSYADLVAADSNADGTTKGYARFFDAWKEAGIL
ncbi:MAG: hypothetical protein ABFD49_08675 [Armatimonadota bacterium]|nr:hypothetical protein [bacterium]